MIGFISTWLQKKLFPLDKNKLKILLNAGSSEIRVSFIDKHAYMNIYLTLMNNTDYSILLLGVNVDVKIGVFNKLVEKQLFEQCDRGGTKYIRLNIPLNYFEAHKLKNENITDNRTYIELAVTVFGNTKFGLMDFGDKLHDNIAAKVVLE